MIHINGRHPIAKMGYLEVGKQIGVSLGYIDVHNCKGGDDFTWLDNEGYPDITELLPQRTVVQFNSTYMELIGRHDRVKGDVTAWSLFLLTIGGIMLYGFTSLFIESIQENQTFMYIFMGLLLVFLGIPLLGMLALLFTEIFTFTYFPIRFNRKTRKVYVRQANRKVDVFNWDDLRFYMSTSKPDHDGADIKALITTDDGVTVKQMFAFPFVSNISAQETLGGKQLKQHFEFVRRYMNAENDEQLEEVKSAIRYINPVHKKRETPLASFQRVSLYAYDSFRNLEYPKESFTARPEHLAILIPLWLRYLGRLLSINTSITPKFSPEIEAECQIDPNDPYDLNKNLPEGNLEQRNQPMWKTVVYSVGTAIATIAMIFVGAFIIDLMGAARPHGYYPSMVGKLWYVVSLGWLS